MNMKLVMVLAGCAFLSAPLIGSSQVKPLPRGTVERIKVHGKGLEGNLSGDSPNRFVSVYLPASYRPDSKRRYPVVYFLHGFTDSDAKWYGLSKHWINLPAILDTAFSEHPSAEMIFVTPDAYTRFKGSFYSNSVTTGNWEDFVAKELVSFIDSHYNTIPLAASRGLAGHSMGGHGAIRIGPKYPGIFSVIYLLSPAVMRLYHPLPPQDIEKMETVRTEADLEKSDFWVNLLFALAAAWSPDPEKPPFYLDRPVKGNSKLITLQAKWAANSPFSTMGQYVSNYKKLRAIGFDAGDKDEGIAADIKALHQELAKYGIKHTYEVYNGNHVNKVGARIKLTMIPFFSERLSFTGKK